MIPFPEARARILERVPSPTIVTVPLAELAGRVIAENLVAPFDVPHGDNSQVDGYAVRSEDGAASRRLAGVSAAGGNPPPALSPGETIRIFTGAPIPPGADAVVMQEDVTVTDGRVVFGEAPEPELNVRRRGEELTAGTRIATAGRLATPPLVGLAASFGRASLAVTRLPRVSLVATGSELTPVGTELGPGRVYASNPWALSAAITALGIPAPAVTLVADDPAATRDALDRALAASDVVLTMGGVSVGDHDLVRPALAGLGVEEVFWRVAIRPGKPFAFGVRGETLVFGLPGNPVSALVTYLVLVRPALLRWIGAGEVEPEIDIRTTAAIERSDLRYEFLRATLDGDQATPVAHQGSHMQSGLAAAEALLHLPDGIARVEAGETLRATPIRWGLGS